MSTSIIIADDHPLMLRGLSDFLTSKGFNILASANNGNEAYNLIVKHKPDIAILDKNPLEDISNIRTVSAVMTNGQYYKGIFPCLRFGVWTRLF